MIQLFERIENIHHALLTARSKGHSIGFVPTMGALHEGHISLMKRCVEENDISVSSIFVNPIQFNNQQDLIKYPRTLANDIAKLDAAGCQMVFAPSVEEMYPEEATEKYDFGALEQLMEGASRPGHFNGVGVVVNRLFDICIPHRAYFGEKDFQQLLIIRELVKLTRREIEIIGCPIIREADGLAMSSRNVRLSADERALAPNIFSTLNWIREHAGEQSPAYLASMAADMLSKHHGVRVEYVQIVDEQSLMPINTWSETQTARAFVALFLGEVRLIDNMKIC